MNSSEPFDRRMSRFLLAKSQFARTTGKVKPAAFLPPANRRLSVFETTNSTEENIWALGGKHVAAPREKPLYGRADLGSNAIERAGLVIEPSAPPPAHADLIGWPDDVGWVADIALQLSLQARLVLNHSV